MPGRRISDRARRERNRTQMRNAGASHSNAGPIFQPTSTDGFDSLVSYTPQMIDAADHFERALDELRIFDCPICKCHSPSLTMNASGPCKDCQKNAEKFTSFNNMDPGSLPPELQGLTPSEQMLIAQVHPVVTLYRIRGAQLAYSGNVIKFRQNIDHYITELPLNPSALSFIIVFQKESLSGVSEFQARAGKLRTALEWLKQNNIYYRNISISENNLVEIGEDRNLSSHFQSLNIEPSLDPLETEVEESYVPLIDTLDQDSHIARQLKLPYPELNSTPINEFTEEGYMARAFSCLFPFGQGDYLQPRRIPVSLDEYFKYLIDYDDGRFAKDHRFRFFAMNTIMRKQALRTSGIFMKRTSLEHQNVEGLKSRIQNDPSFLQQLMVYCSNIRSTELYWRSRCSELLAMVSQLGMPSIFITLSYADHHYPSLFKLIAPDREPSTLSNQERKTLMQDNPYLTAWYFHRRVKLFFDKILIPIFKVRDFWFRFEWQHRGSPHIHGLLWIDDAPVYDKEDLNEEEMNEIIRYFEDLCIALNPTDPDDTPQIHPSKRSFREDEASISQSEGYNQFCPKRNDQWVTRYNPLITQVWRGNTDVSPVTSKKAVSNYVCKYATKEEVASASFKDSARDIAQQQPDESPARRAIQKVMISTIGERNYSAQEDDDWSRIIVNQIDETVRTRETVVDKYSRRPHELGGESLLKFVKNYMPAGSTFQKRQEEIIVRVFPQLKLTGDPIEDEKYYKLQCILTIPFERNYESLLQEHRVSKWKDLYEQNRDQMIEEMEFPDPENDDPLPEPVNEENYQDANMVVAEFRGEINDQLIGTRLIDVAYDWNSTSSRIPGFSAAQDFLKISKTQERETPHQSSNRINFSSEQQQVLKILDSQLRSLCSRVPRLYKRVVVQGKARSGKSTIIREIVNRVVSACGERAIRVCAPTGAAAVNIEGNTIHSLLRVPLNIKKMQSLNGEAARKFQSEMKDLKFIIIDEMSMIGARLLNVIERRLRELNSTVDEPFGGLFIYLFGDFRQLPPVKDSPLYASTLFDEMASQGKMTFEQFQKFIQLSQTHRQVAPQAPFIELLDNLSNGTFSHEDLCLLNTRSRSYLTDEDLESFRDAIELLSTNEQVRESNENFLRSTGHPVARIASINQPNIANHTTDDSALGLHKTVNLSVGSRVMLRTNVWVTGGLVNGSLGTVRHIIYGPDERPPALPLFILVEFDNYRGPYLYENTFPIVPITRSWIKKEVTCSRRQYPLSLAYAVTIHKSQGLTLNKIKVDIGKRESSLGLTYVALSRVRSLNDIILSASYPAERFQSIVNAKAHKDRQNFLRRWHNDSV
ncbi:uncharacterized protein LOC141851589 [Brevipalpus obovatus]|uniref:uncharacterized protein LOC141851589 n=1 Tax=Brevipalpus obovatus TaxID=246614 RepID=UPI003D9E225F